jgi:hypothetical protein
MRSTFHPRIEYDSLWIARAVDDERHNSNVWNYHSNLISRKDVLMKAKLTRSETSEYLKRVHGISRSPNTLAKLASIGIDGPKFSVFGRKPMYDPADIDEWVNSKMSKKIRFASELKTEPAPTHEKGRL